MTSQHPTKPLCSILSLIADPPHPHRSQLPGDLPGTFTIWFEGGALKSETGFTTYYFADGSRAVTGTSLFFAVRVRLADGRFFEIIERDPSKLDPGVLIGFE